MGELISLDERRAGRSARVGARPHRPVEPVRFCFDLASPWTYLAAERVERIFGDLRWQPIAGAGAVGAAERPAVEARARELRMPLVWPEGTSSGRAALRIAALAAERGCAAAFVVSAGRLAFCGGYDLDDPEVFAEAAAAAGLGLEEALTAARDRARDTTLARSTDALPALSIGGRLFCGERRIPEAAAAYADLRSTGSSRLVPTRDWR